MVLCNANGFTRHWGLSFLCLLSIINSFESFSDFLVSLIGVVAWCRHSGSSSISDLTREFFFGQTSGWPYEQNSIEKKTTIQTTPISHYIYYISTIRWYLVVFFAVAIYETYRDVTPFMLSNSLVDPFDARASWRIIEETLTLHARNLLLLSNSKKMSKYSEGRVREWEREIEWNGNIYDIDSKLIGTKRMHRIDKSIWFIKLHWMKTKREKKRRILKQCCQYFLFCFWIWIYHASIYGLPYFYLWYSIT